MKMNDNEKSHKCNQHHGSDINSTLFEDQENEVRSQPLFTISGTYFATPNELAEHLTELDFDELKFYMFVARKTLGFHKVKSEISSKEFENHTGLNRESVKLIRESLKRKRLIDFEILPFDGEKRRSVYRLPGAEAICKNPIR
jgi:hypothetical protein